VLAFATASAVIEIEPLPDPFGGRVSELAGGNIEPSTPDPTLPLWPALPLLAAFCLWLLPKVTDMFFVRIGRSRMQRFVFALAGMAAGATVALMGGIEGLIGAFLAGLGMNQPIPNRGPLMLGLLFTAFVIVGKSVAAISTGIMFKFSFDEIALMLSLSFGQAASTLAIAQVGLSLGIFSQIVVNASVIASVLTALLTSYGTANSPAGCRGRSFDHPPLGEEVILDMRSHGSELEDLVTLQPRSPATTTGWSRPTWSPHPASGRVRNCSSTMRSLPVGERTRRRGNRPGRRFVRATCSSWVDPADCQRREGSHARRSRRHHLDRPSNPRDGSVAERDAEVAGGEDGVAVERHRTHLADRGDERHVVDDRRL
jgi:hypothetical protein